MGHLIEADWKELWRDTNQAEPVGVVFTKPEVVEFILDLAGYQPHSRRLGSTRLLEPSCGDGAFVLSVVRRLIESEKIFVKDIDWHDCALERALTATDINLTALEKAKMSVLRELVNDGCPPERAQGLVEIWFQHTDFLLEPWRINFDFVVGNPPYVRIEDLPKLVLSRYRKLYATASDRADIYVAFIERGLDLLSEHGTLAFICANRFAKNKYGSGLRKFIAAYFHVKYYVNLEHTSPFLTDVSAYPAIFIIDRQRGQRTLSVTAHGDLEAALPPLREEAIGAGTSTHFSSFDNWYGDGSPWISTCDKRALELHKLAIIFPLLEQSGNHTRVGIGVATGADNVFVLPSFAPGIEADRQLPLIMAGDVTNDRLRFSGHYLINPFQDKDGSLIDLNEYPGLAAYLHEQRTKLEKRHVSRKRPQNWYRTIDRIWVDWQRMPKLLIPDIRSTAIIGLDKGEYYPHHNLYWITSDSWPLSALKALLRSSKIHRQVEAFSVQMRGGSLRFQAQTLRKLRLPAVGSLAPQTIRALERVSTSECQSEIDDVADHAFEEHASHFLMSSLPDRGERQ